MIIFKKKNIQENNKEKFNEKAGELNEILEDIQYHSVAYFSDTAAGPVRVYFFLIGATLLGKEDAILHTISISKEESSKKTFTKEEQKNLIKERGIRFIRLSDLIKEYGFIVLINENEDIE